MWILNWVTFIVYLDIVYLDITWVHGFMENLNGKIKERIGDLEMIFFRRAWGTEFNDSFFIDSGRVVDMVGLFNFIDIHPRRRYVTTPKYPKYIPF